MTQRVILKNTQLKGILFVILQKEKHYCDEPQIAMKTTFNYSKKHANLNCNQCNN